MVKAPMNLTSKTPFVTLYCVQTKKIKKVALNGSDAKKLSLSVTKNGKRVTRLLKYETCTRIISEDDYKALSKLGVKKSSSSSSSRRSGCNIKKSKTTCEKTGCKWVSGKKGGRKGYCRKSKNSK